jgi:hypothetical protein
MLELIAATILVATASPDAAPDDTWALVKMKGRDVAIHPKTGEQRELPVQGQDGLLSPDSTRIVYWGTTPGEKTIDMFIADVSLGEPGSQPVKKNSRKLLTGALGMHDFAWAPDARNILFVSDHSVGAQVYLISTELAAGADLAAVKPVQISDSSGTCSRPRFASDGRIAWLILRERNGKERLFDLVISDGKTPGALAAAPKADPDTPKPAAPGAKVQQQQLKDPHALPAPPLPPAPAGAPPGAPDAVVAPLAFTTFLKRANLHAFEFRPDASQIAYSFGTSLAFHTFATNGTRTFAFANLDPKLTSHGMHDMAWRPDGKVLAGTITFLGGRSVPQGGEPYFIFGDKELFFVPLQGEAWWVARPPESRSVSWISPDLIPKDAPAP